MSINPLNMPREPMAHQQAENQQRQMQAAMMGQQNKLQPTIIPEWFAAKIGEESIRHWNETNQLREVLKLQAANIEELKSINATVGKQLAEALGQLNKQVLLTVELQKYIDRFGELEPADTAVPAGEG